MTQQTIPDNRNTPAASGADRRRCKRLFLSFHIEVAGSDSTGEPFCDRTVTLDVSDEGCRFNLLRQVVRGAELAIRLAPREGKIPSSSRPLRFEVAWIETSERGWVIGATKLQPENIWHMAFPKRNPPPNSSPTSLP